MARQTKTPLKRGLEAARCRVLCPGADYAAGRGNGPSRPSGRGL